MDKLVIYDFRIDAWTPETLPMSRLAEYLARLSALLGNKEHVHFMKVRKGSAVPEIAVAPAANPKVIARLKLVGTPDAPEEVSRSQQDINHMLRDDGATAYLRIKGGARILEFSGVKTPLAEEVVLLEQGELEGMVIRIGGKDETVPVMLEGEDGTFYRCNTKREMAKQLAPYLFGQRVRIHGRGKWRRTPERAWELDNFDIKTFEPLDESPLADVIETLRGIEGSQWNEMNNPQEELKKLRGD